MSDAERSDEMPSNDFQKFEALRSGALHLDAKDARMFKDLCALPAARRMIEYSTLIYVDLKPPAQRPADPDGLDQLSQASDYEEEEEDAPPKCSFILPATKRVVVPPPPPIEDAASAAATPGGRRGLLSNAIPGLICNLLALEQVAHDCGVQGLDYGLLERVWTLYHQPDAAASSVGSRRKQRSAAYGGDEETTADDDVDYVPRRRRRAKNN